jgi:hypothetical protein
VEDRADGRGSTKATFAPTWTVKFAAVAVAQGM